MNHGLGLLDSDDEPSSRDDRASRAIHAAGLDSDGEDLDNKGSAVPDVNKSDECTVGGHEGSNFRAFGLEGSDDEFNQRHRLGGEEERQPSPGPKTFKPIRNHGPPEVMHFRTLGR